MKAQIFITPKKGVLDPQGKAIAHALENLGFSGIGEVRQGKYIEIDLGPAVNEADSRTKAQQMCEKLLANPVMEDFEVKFVA